MRPSTTLYIALAIASTARAAPAVSSINIPWLNVPLSIAQQLDSSTISKTTVTASTTSVATKKVESAPTTTKGAASSPSPSSSSTTSSSSPSLRSTTTTTTVSTSLPPLKVISSLRSTTGPVATSRSTSTTLASSGASTASSQIPKQSSSSSSPLPPPQSSSSSSSSPHQSSSVSPKATTSPPSSSQSLPPSQKASTAQASSAPSSPKSSDVPSVTSAGAPSGPTSSTVISSASHKTEAATLTTSLAPSASEKVFPKFDPKWIVRGHAIDTGRPSLGQNKTNGRSRLGTFRADRFWQFKGQNKWNDYSNCPWGAKSASNTNTYTDPPNTGVTQSFEFTVERGILAPDGVNRSVILVNGAFPGPTIEANWGDTINVTVHNKITGPEEGTSIHWHGFLQKGTPHEDGVPGIMQCPIAPGQSFTYSFKADLYGTSWWHAHYSAQYAAGVFGAMVIHGPTQDEPEAKYDSDIGPILISDYYHRDYYSIVQEVMGTDLTKVSPKSDNNLINGKGIIDCNATAISDGNNATLYQSCTPNAGLSKFNFTSGQSYRMRLINAGSEGLQKFSIDSHDLTVIAYDFVPIKPYKTQIVTLGVGQRADIVVKANQDPSGAYWLRSTMTKCSNTNQPNGLAMIYYEHADKDSSPKSVAQTDTTDPCANDDLKTTVPYYPIQPPSTPAASQAIDINFGINATGNVIWTINNSTFRTDYNKPILPLLQSGTNTSTMPPEWNIYDFGSASSIRITLNNRSPVSHPMHIHGHNMYVLSSSSNISNNPVVVNPSNPARRDVQILPPNGQVVLQIDGDNPGVWPLHCHIAWHVSGGLYMNVVERPDDVKKTRSPPVMSEVCNAWSAWTASQSPDQIDSGLRT